MVSKSRLFSALEYTYAIIGLLLISDSLGPIIYNFYMDAAASDELTESNPKRLIIAICIYAIALIFVVRRYKEPMRLLVRRPDIIILTMLPLVSALWSFDMVTILRRAAAHFLTIVFCFYIVTRYTPEELLKRLVIVFAIGGACSLLLCLAVPSIGIEQASINHGAWYGIYGQKATTGRVCVLAVFAAFFLKPETAAWRMTRWFTLFCFLFLAVMSQSRASWLLILGGFVLYGVLTGLRSPRFTTGLKLSFVGALAATIVGTVLAGYGKVLEMMGRDLTFSGRTKLWEAAIEVASGQHPWLGVGYRAFWIGPSAIEVRSHVNFVRIPYHGHNGYLDLWLELGWLGVGLVIAFSLFSLYGLIRSVVRDPERPVWIMFTLFFLLLLFNNVSVSVVMRHTDLAWVLGICATLYATQRAYREKLDRQAKGSFYAR